MDSTKYVGMDVHTEAISVAVRNSAGKLIMESILETKANTILEFIQGLRGNVHVTFEEGTWAAWLYDSSVHVQKVRAGCPKKYAESGRGGVFLLDISFHRTLLHRNCVLIFHFCGAQRPRLARNLSVEASAALRSGCNLGGISDSYGAKGQDLERDSPGKSTHRRNSNGS
jgi:hypothetical protein